MSDESKFSDEEIQQHLRETASRRKNVDYNQLQAKRELIVAARNDAPEEFQARVAGYGIDLNSEKGKTIMAAYWAIRRETRR